MNCSFEKEWMATILKLGFEDRLLGIRDFSVEECYTYPDIYQN